MRDLVEDLRLAARRLRLAPAFTAVGVLSLALGIGAATAIFSLAYGTVLRPLAYPQAGRLVFVREVLPQLERLYPSLPANVQHFRLWRGEARGAEAMGAFLGSAVTLAGGDAEPERLDAAEVSANLLSVLGAQPALGRSFLAGEEQAGRNRVVVITDSLWRRRFGRAPGLVGRAISIDGVPHTVVGILPPSFRFPHQDDLGPLANLGRRAELFRPLGKTEEGWGGDYDYNVIARLRPEVSAQRLRAELDLLEAGIDREHRLHEDLRVTVRPLQEVITGQVRTPLFALLGGVGLLLLIVCANLANLILARSSARARELAIRTALGASPVRLMRELLAESLLLAAAGGLLGATAAAAAVRAFVSAAPVDLPRLDEVGVDAHLVVFVVALVLACGVVTGLLPALRLAAHAPAAVLRAQSHTVTEGRRAARLRESLVGAEVCLCTVLLVLASLLTSSLWQLLRTDRGFHADRALALKLTPSAAAWKQPARFFELALAQARTLPGVVSAAFVSRLPLTGESNVNQVELEPADRDAADPRSFTGVEINVRFVSSGYFATLGIPLLRGRDIEPADAERAVTVISERLAARLWPGREALGRSLTTGSGVGKVEVVGVVRDVPSSRLEAGTTMMAYVPFWKRGMRSGEIVIRSAADPAAIMPGLRRRMRDLDPAIAVPEIRTMAGVVATATAQRRFVMELAGAFALCALLLAVLGIYGMVAYHVALRRTEIGVRLALGARLTQLVRRMVSRGLRPPLAGLAAGLAAALAAGQLVRSLLYRVAPHDPLILAAVVLLLAATAALGCLLPSLAAARAARRDPAHILRQG